MHPPLFKDHPDCKEVVNALVQCHEEHNVGKFFGLCNEQKARLDHCFFLEKDAKRKVIAEKAMREERAFEKYLADLESKNKG